VYTSQEEWYVFLNTFVERLALTAGALIRRGR